MRSQQQYTDLDPHFALRTWAVVDVRARVRRAAERERTERHALARPA
ncbi:MAG: hypothetical protein S0880_03520 [Actinomycetota bacterium]|nr:hypothetical protein [Actinomycetota bacterium]